MPKISIVTPCYNAEKFIARTIGSVRAQDFTDWEQTVVDDGSTDGSAAVIEALAAVEPRLRLVRRPNGGVARARNTGYAASSTDSRYLLFLDADDCLEPKMLQALSEYLDGRPEVGLVHCDLRRVDGDDRAVDAGSPLQIAPKRWTRVGRDVRPIPAASPQTPFESLFAWSGIIPSICLLRRSVYDRTPGWDETFGQPFEDTDLFLHMALLAEVHYLPEVLVRYRVHAAQSTGNRKRLWDQERKLYRKWLSGRGLTDEQHRRVCEAWRFRERTLMPRLCMRWFVESVRRGAAIESLKHPYRAGRHLVNFAAGVHSIRTSRARGSQG